MVVRNSLLIAALAMVLSACLSPREQCQYEAEAQLRDLRDELAERRANLTRGYRLEQQVVPMYRMTICTNASTGQPFACTQWDTEVVENRQPIDPTYEAEAVALLERQVEREERLARDRVAQCALTYPAE